MAVNLKGRSFLTLEDFTPAEIRYLLDLGHDLKAKRRAGISGPDAGPACSGRPVRTFRRPRCKVCGSTGTPRSRGRPASRRNSNSDPFFVNTSIHLLLDKARARRIIL